MKKFPKTTKVVRLSKGNMLSIRNLKELETTHKISIKENSILRWGIVPSFKTPKLRDLCSAIQTISIQLDLSEISRQIAIDRSVVMFEYGITTKTV
jgi:hypothetical protein